MTNTFRPNCLPTLIGSLPLVDHQKACELVFEHVPEIPIWVQLPVFKEEGMLRQFLPGMPGFALERGKAFINKAGEAFDADLLAFYEDYMAVAAGEKALPDSRFKLTPETAAGFFALQERLKRSGESPAAIKGQITGPITFTTGVGDQDGRAVFYDDQLRDAAVKLLALKAQWQLREFKPLGCPTIMFFDEPALAGFGSSEFISISREDIAACLGEVIDAVHAEGGLAGVHVCANTDWSLLLDSDVDIINFDAYAYFDRFILYPGQIRRFVNSGRILAWGIVPTLNPEDIEKENVDSLMDAWREKFGQIEALGIDRKQIMAQSMITPSCGAGSLSHALARKVLSLTRELSDRIRSEY
ncbi:MAG: hypothetical protein AB1427_21055 [Thermodesulfobacteriota bacterium]